MDGISTSTLSRDFDCVKNRHDLLKMSRVGPITNIIYICVCGYMHSHVYSNWRAFLPTMYLIEGENINCLKILQTRFIRYYYDYQESKEG